MEGMKQNWIEKKRGYENHSQSIQFWNFKWQTALEHIPGENDPRQPAIKRWGGGIPPGRFLKNQMLIIHYLE